MCHDVDNSAGTWGGFDCQCEPKQRGRREQSPFTPGVVAMLPFHSYLPPCCVLFLSLYMHSNTVTQFLKKHKEIMAKEFVKTFCSNRWGDTKKKLKIMLINLQRSKRCIIHPKIVKNLVNFRSLSNDLIDESKIEETNTIENKPTHRKSFKKMRNRPILLKHEAKNKDLDVNASLEKLDWRYVSAT
jgi:hypothetical protein